VQHNLIHKFGILYVTINLVYYMLHDDIGKWPSPSFAKIKPHAYCLMVGIKN